MNTVDWAPIIGCENAKNNKISFKTHNTTTFKTKLEFTGGIKLN